MAALNDKNETDPQAGWFSRLSRRGQALLMALLAWAVSAVLFLLGVHGWLAREPIVNMAGKSDWTDDLFWSAFTFVLGACLLAVSMGWKPEDFWNRLRK